MEARLAAHGSGAVERSSASGKRLLNIDIGGGTAEIAVISLGGIVSCGSARIGGNKFSFKVWQRPDTKVFFIGLFSLIYDE